MKRNPDSLISMSLTALVLAAPAFGGTGSIAHINVSGGPHAGKYEFSSDDACIIAALPGKAVGFSLFIMGEKSSLTLDIPNAANTGQLQIELVVADVKPGQSRKNTASAIYVIDTRPDASLEPYQLAERQGATGQAGAKLTHSGDTAKLTFDGSTARGVKMSGTVDCKKVDREYGR